MNWIVLLLGIIILLFGFVIFVGAPYLPTLKPQRIEALDLLNLSKGQLLVELGCGDGAMLLAAAERGINAVGYELNPVMAAVAWLRTRRYRRQVRVIWGNLWGADLADADGVYVFILDRFMPKLQNYLSTTEHKKHLKVTSFTFKFPTAKIVRQTASVYLYVFD